MNWKAYWGLLTVTHLLPPDEGKIIMRDTLMNGIKSRRKFYAKNVALL